MFLSETSKKGEKRSKGSLQAWLVKKKKPSDVVTATDERKLVVLNASIH